MSGRGLTETELIDEASRLVLYGASVFGQTVAEQPHWMAARAPVPDHTVRLPVRLFAEAVLAAASLSRNLS